MTQVRCVLWINGKKTGIEATFTTKAMVEFINRTMNGDGKQWEWQEIVPITPGWSYNDWT
jgi:hypothetical protein